jgi:S-adenosylmethionine/arginine decarboxylase-like enzyme
MHEHGEASPPSSSAAAWRLVTADLANVSPTAFTEAARVEAALARGLGPLAVGIHWMWHRFDPTGVSVVGMGPRVRVAFHTWPERGRATVDVYAPDPNLEPILQRLSSVLLAE